MQAYQCKLFRRPIYSGSICDVYMVSRNWSISVTGSTCRYSLTVTYTRIITCIKYCTWHCTTVHSVGLHVCCELILCIDFICKLTFIFSFIQTCRTYDMANTWSTISCNCLSRLKSQWVVLRHSNFDNQLASYVLWSN